MKKIRAILVSVIIMGISFVSAAWGADIESFQLQATIPPQSSVNVSISKVVGTTFTPAADVNFGSLVRDNTNNIFKSSDNGYYCLDVGVISNVSSWTLTHAVTSITNGTDNLNNKINVTFMNQQNAAAATQLSRVSYSASNGVAITKSQISSGGWLRIYYGLATGSGDGAGISVIPLTQAGGAYGGNIILTLAQ